MIHVNDTKKTLSKALAHVIGTKHPTLANAGLRFLPVWRMDPRYEDGMRVLADVSKLSNRDRDIFAIDIRLVVDREAWKVMNKQEKIKLLDHEMQHIFIEREGELDEDIEEGGEEDTREFKYDKAGRLCFYLLPHDLQIMRFRKELLHHGLTNFENETRLFLNRVYKEKGLCGQSLEESLEERLDNSDEDDDSEDEE